MSIVVFEAASDYSGLVSLGGDGFEFEPYERKDHFLAPVVWLTDFLLVMLQPLLEGCPTINCLLAH